MIDYSKIQLVSSASSNKILMDSSGSLLLAALPGVGETTTTATIPFPDGFTSDNLLFQVSTNGGTQDGTILPWQSNDGRLTLYASINATSLYITGISSDSSGAGAPAYTILYYYRVLVP